MQNYIYYKNNHLTTYSLPIVSCNDAGETVLTSQSLLLSTPCLLRNLNR